MSVPRIGTLVVAAAVMLSMAFVIGCETTTAPDSTNDSITFEKPQVDRGNGPPETGAQPPRGNGHRNMPVRPIRARFKSAEPVWIVSHFAEEGCNGPVAGAEVQSRGNVSHLGLTTVSAAAAWDWSLPAAGSFMPAGPTTGPSATVMDSYPFDFCSAPQTATGEVSMVAANGDELYGRIMGGEVYELGFDQAGDGQEQFIMVRVDGGTGRFRHAQGEFVLHLMAMFDMFEFQVLRSEMLPGGWLQY